MYPEDELADEPWYHVGPGDVFPEEFVRFLQLRGEIRDEFLAGHRELFSASFWQDMQDRNCRGEVIDVFPYREERRLLQLARG